MRFPFGLNIVEILFLSVVCLYVFARLINHIRNIPYPINYDTLTMAKSQVQQWIPSGVWNKGYEENKQCISACKWGGIPGPGSANQVPITPNNPHGYLPWCFTNTKNRCKEDPRWGYCTDSSTRYNDADKYIFSSSQTCNS